MQSTLEILQELNQGFIRSVRLSDVAWFERHLSHDFLNSNADGTLVDRAAFLRVAAPCLVAAQVPVSGIIGACS